MLKQPDPEPEVVDSSHLTDADWANINSLRALWSAGGSKALSRALAKLAETDQVAYIRVVGAYFPHDVQEAIRDAMAAQGMTEEDLQEIIRKHESPAGKQ